MLTEVTCPVIVAFMVNSRPDNRLMFSFDPSESSLHRFDGVDKPQSMRDVYKVYYTWALARSVLNRGSNTWGEYETVFEMHRDECSAITTLADAIRHALKSKSKTKDYSIGQPGSLWEIDYISHGTEDKEDCDTLCVRVRNNVGNSEYSFELTKLEAKKFIDNIGVINRLMLDLSEPI